MPQVRKVTLDTSPNYPRAKTRKKSVGSTHRKPRTRQKSNSHSQHHQAHSTRDTFQSGHHDPQMSQMDRLRREAARGKQKGPTLDVKPDYPQVKGKGKTSDPSGGPSKPTKQAPETNVPRKQTTNSGGNKGTRNSNPQYQIDTTPDYPRTRRKTKSELSKYDQEVALLEGAKRRQAAHEESLKTKRPTRKSQTPKRTKRSKPRVRTNKKLAAGGGFKAISGSLMVKNGINNIANGNYAEGGLELAQGGMFAAEGIQDLNAARQGMSQAPTTKLSKTMKVGGMVLNGAMAAYDTKQAYDAFQGGNEVEASERAGSAIINAVSTFPPTAVIGAIGGVADWAMDASGADDLMVKHLTKGRKAYEKQISADIKMARTLMHTSNRRLRLSDRAEKKKYMRGINGMRELRKVYAKEGDKRSVRLIDQHIVRVKKAWTKR